MERLVGAFHVAGTAANYRGRKSAETNTQNDVLHGLASHPTTSAFSGVGLEIVVDPIEHALAEDPTGTRLNVELRRLFGRERKQRLGTGERVIELL